MVRGICCHILYLSFHTVNFHLHYDSIAFKIKNIVWAFSTKISERVVQSDN